MGQILHLVRHRGESGLYSNKDACRQCPNKCTFGKSLKRVSIGPNTRVVPVKMYGNSKFPPQPIPPDLPVSSFNHTLDRPDLVKKKVQMRIRSDERILKKRMCLSEHPFGTVKWHHDARYLLCRGLEKTTGELGLSFLVYNLKRAIHLVGVPALVDAMRG